MDPLTTLAAVSRPDKGSLRGHPSMCWAYSSRQGTRLSLQQRIVRLVLPERYPRCIDDDFIFNVMGCFVVVPAISVST